MANIKDRIGRLEVRMIPQVDQRAINEAAEQFNKMFNRMLDGLRPEDATIPLDERPSKMSVMQHAAWCVGFIPDFQMSMASLDQLRAMQQAHIGRRAA